MRCRSIEAESAYIHTDKTKQSNLDAKMELVYCSQGKSKTFLQETYNSKEKYNTSIHTHAHTEKKESLQWSKFITIYQYIFQFILFVKSN